MERQYVTLSLPKALLKKAKSLAARKNWSLSDLLQSVLEEKVNEESDYQRARDRQLVLMKTGFDLGSKGRITIARADLFDRQKIYNS